MKEYERFIIIHHHHRDSLADLFLVRTYTEKLLRTIRTSLVLIRNYYYYDYDYYYYYYLKWQAQKRMSMQDFVITSTDF